MSEQEERELIERIKAYTESISGSPEKALEGLVAAWYLHSRRKAC